MGAGLWDRWGGYGKKREYLQEFYSGVSVWRGGSGIRRMTVEGRPATVSYISYSFEPMPPDDADMVKVVFDDGGGIRLA